MSDHDTRGLERAGVVTAVLMPLVGLIIGAVLLAKDRTRQGVICLCMAVVFATTWSVLAYELTKPDVQCSVVDPDYCVEK